MNLILFILTLTFSLLSFATSGISHSSDNITIIGTAGGFVYGIDSHSLEKKWTINTGGALLSAAQVSKLYVTIAL
jgi:hypothetical protein